MDLSRQNVFRSFTGFFIFVGILLAAAVVHTVWPGSNLSGAVKILALFASVWVLHHFGSEKKVGG